MLKPCSANALSLLTAATLPQVSSLHAAEDKVHQVPLPLVRSIDTDRSGGTIKAGMVILRSDFLKDTTLRRDLAYVIDGEVHVRAGVVLTVEDGATILIRNGLRPRRTIDTSALIFDSGSSLRAGVVTFASVDNEGRRVPHPNNGGVFFCGSTRSGTKDGVTAIRRFTSSSFKAERIILDHVGRPDPREGDGNDNDRDDIDAISIIGVGRNEWDVKGIESHGSGDDGVDVYNSTISLDTLIVRNPTEDGVNLTSSHVTINCGCDIETSKSTGLDRELFDFEIDNGRCRLILAKNAFVKLSGIWGSEADDVRLRSSEMPRPPALGAPEQPYDFAGTLTKRATIYSAGSD